MPAPQRSALEQLLVDAAVRSDEHAEFVGITLAAPVAPVEALTTLPGEDSVLFAAPTGLEMAGSGVCAALSAAGSDRFSAIQNRAQELLGRVTSAESSVKPEPPRLLGGFAFQTGRALGELWQPFGEARFVLPRLAYTLRDGAAVLSLFVRRTELQQPSQRHRHAAEFERALAVLEQASARASSTPETQASQPPPAQTPVRDAELWRELVEQISAAINRGQLQKVVLARRVDFGLCARPDAAQVLGRLRAQAGECTRFLISAGGRTFLGAAPERLIKKSGQGFETEAVAGSMKAGESAAISKLLESEKDLLEHGMVVRGILDALEPVASDLVYPRRPELRRLKHVLHLRTPIRGQVVGSRHVLSLVERLHPTPSVGGVPTDAALDWIASHERDERGWYAGPFGWFDARGDGEFVVALRSGVLESERAHLYVGAGIVRGSSPLEEFAETQWKLAALASALGVRQ